MTIPTACEYCVCGNAIAGRYDSELKAIVFERQPCTECGSYNRQKISLEQ